MDHEIIDRNGNEGQRFQVSEYHNVVLKYPAVGKTIPNADNAAKIATTRVDFKLLGSHNSLLDDTDSETSNSSGYLQNQQQKTGSVDSSGTPLSARNGGSIKKDTVSGCGNDLIRGQYEKSILYEDSDSDESTASGQIYPAPARGLEEVHERTQITVEREKHTIYQSEAVDSSDSSQSPDLCSDRQEIMGLLSSSRPVVSPMEHEAVEIQVAAALGWAVDSDKEEISEEEMARRETAHNIAVLQMHEDADFRKREAARQMELAEKRLREAEAEQAQAKPVIHDDKQVKLADEDSESEEISEDEHERRETAHTIAILHMQEEANFRKQEIARRIDLAEKQRDTDTEKARRNSIQADQRRLDEIRRKQDDLEAQEQNRLILLRLEAEEKRFKDEAEYRFKEEERLLEEAHKSLDRAQREAERHADHAERRKQAPLQPQITDENDARQEAEFKQVQGEHLKCIKKAEALTEGKTLINQENEKTPKKKAEDERKRAAAQQALAAQAMAAQLRKKREERLEREREEKERHEKERLERERLERESTERKAELVRKRDRIQELQRLKRIAQERERKLQEQQRNGELTALQLVPKPMEDPSSSSQTTASFAPPDSTRYEAPDSPSKGSYSFATITSTRRYPVKKQATAVTTEQLRGPVEANRQLKIRVRPLLSWRSDPSESFSDWKVVVRHQGTRQVDEYHVHRNIVGYGPRKSGFFAKEFSEFDRRVRQERGRNYAEPTSQLTLPSGLADAISFALDYLYLTEGDTQPTLTADKACRVFKLAERLEMPTLQTTVAEFYRQHIKASNMGMFLRVATLHDASKLTFIAKAQIGSLVTEDPTCARLLKPTFLGQLADILAQHRAGIRMSISKNKTSSEFEKIQRLHSKRWSRAIVYCSQAAGNVFDPDLLEKLANEEALPVVDGTASLGLLRLYETVTGGRGRQRDSLDRRCALGLMEDWILVERQFASRKLLLAELHTFLPFKLEQQILGYVGSRYG